MIRAAVSSLLLLSLAATMARADTGPKLALEAALGGEFDTFDTGGYNTKVTGSLLCVGVAVPLLATVDVAVKVRIFTVFSNIAGIGSSVDALVRWFPLTYARPPVFEAGGRSIEFRYRLMPYVGLGLGINFQSATAVDQSNLLAVMPRAPLVLGTYLPLSPKLALQFELGGAFARTLKGGGILIQELSTAATAGIALFL